MTDINILVDNLTRFPEYQDRALVLEAANVMLALVEENENLRQANLDCVDHYEDAVAELRRLQAMGAGDTP